MTNAFIVFIFAAISFLKILLLKLKPISFLTNCLLIFGLMIMVSCSTDGDDNGGAQYSNLAQYAALSSHLDSGNVIACSASAKEDSNLVYTFFYPRTSNYDFKYFVTDSVPNDEKDLSLYKPENLVLENVFQGYLKRFVHPNPNAKWSIVTFLNSQTYSQSNPIQFKHLGKATEWTDQVQMDLSDKLKPKFSWDDGRIKENAIYFQVISDDEGNLLSGTYTTDKHFTYQDSSNVVFDINRTWPSDLIAGEDYNFTLMAVSLDNWVNLVIQKSFSIPD